MHMFLFLRPVLNKTCPHFFLIISFYSANEFQSFIIIIFFFSFFICLFLLFLFYFFFFRLLFLLLPLPLIIPCLLLFLFSFFFVVYVFFFPRFLLPSSPSPPYFPSPSRYSYLSLHLTKKTYPPDNIIKTNDKEK